MAPEAARRAALLEAGGVEQVKESIRDVSPRTLLRSASAGCPLRPAADAPRAGTQPGRRRRRSRSASARPRRPSASSTPCSCGRSTTHDADALVVVMHRRTNPVAPANYLDWQRHASGFASMGAAEYWTPTLGREPDPEKLFALRVSDEMLPMLGVPPAIGRFPRARRRRRARGGHRGQPVAACLWRRSRARSAARSRSTAPPTSSSASCRRGSSSRRSGRPAPSSGRRSCSAIARSVARRQQPARLRAPRAGHVDRPGARVDGGAHDRARVAVPGHEPQRHRHAAERAWSSATRGGRSSCSSPPSGSCCSSRAPTSRTCCSRARRRARRRWACAPRSAPAGCG